MELRGGKLGEPCEGDVSHVPVFTGCCCVLGRHRVVWSLTGGSHWCPLADPQGSGARMSLEGSVWAGQGRRGRAPSLTGKMLPHLGSQHQREALAAGDDDLHKGLCISKPQSPLLLPMKTGSNCTHCQEKSILFPGV